MEKNFKKLLKEKKVLVSDGAWGTEIAKNKDVSTSYPEILNLTHPEIIEGIARAYIEAGSDIILTNTFGGNFFKLKKYGAEEKIKEINEVGVKISLKAAGNKIVFASMGPTGYLLQPYGDLTEKEAENCFLQQAEILLKAGADGIVIETMIDINEALCALKAIKSITDRPVVVSMTYNKGKNGFKTLMGTTVEECSLLIEKNGADVVGANCSFGIENFIQIAKEIKSATEIPVWIKPNAGLPQLISGTTVYPDTPEYMSKFIPDLIESGASIIGGCCGTTPQHIRKIAQTVSEYLMKQ